MASRTTAEIKRSQLKLSQEFNIVEELLERNARDSPNSPAIHEVSSDDLKVKRTLNYEELLRHANMVGNALLDSGVEREQRIGIMLSDGVEFVSSFLGSMKIGAVPILLSTYLSDEQLVLLLNDSRAKVLFIQSELAPKVLGDKAKLDFTKNIVSSGGQAEGTESYDDFLKGKSQALELAKTSKDDVAFWFFTSGSTGLPKGVVHLHHDLYYAGLTYYDDVLHASKGDRFLSGAKLYFSAGLGFGLYGPLIVGASTVLYSGRPSARTMLEVLKNTKPTAFLGVPTLYAQMGKILLEETSSKADISTVRVFATGGEPLSPVVFKEWKKLTGVEITEAIGSAEVCHHYISNIVGKSRPGTCGKLMKGYSAKVVDDEGKEIGVNQIGRLFVSGESTFVNYWHLHEATKRTILGEWINTGDLFYVDEEGYYHFCGRTDFAFKIHGLWVSPIEIENAILDTSLVTECCVVSLQGSDGIARAIAYVVPKESNLTEKELTPVMHEKLDSRLSKYKIPDRFIIRPDLAKTAVGKLDRSSILRDARITLKI